MNDMAYEVMDVKRLTDEEVLFLLETMMNYIDYFSNGGVWDDNFDEDIEWIDKLFEKTFVPESEDLKNERLKQLN
jgi:hypothetical protein|tara:strand:- start:10931 stop:11155 length:225 start_codon:yes stop_codon:yes gene_type:complete